MLELRDYQKTACRRTVSYFENDGRAGLLVLPTGAGKSMCISALCVWGHMQGKRTWVVTHRSELCRQNQKAIAQMRPGIKTSLYGASLGETDLSGDVVFALRNSMGIQADKGNLPGTPPDILMVDEAHAVPPDNGDSYYGKLVSHLQQRNPELRLLGFTATPYRLGSGWLHEGDDRVFDTIIYDHPIKDLIDRGYLIPPIAYGGSGGERLSEVSKNNGEFSIREQDQVLEDAAEGIVESMITAGADRKKWIVFAPGVAGARLLSAMLDEKGISNDYIFGDTPEQQRQITYEQFRDDSSGLQCLVCVDIATEGFDVPNIDMVVLARSTESAGLYVQMVGRGLRPHPGVENCKILDFGRNVERHGPLDDIEPKAKGERRKPKMKECPECRKFSPIAALTCVHCDTPFEKQDRISKVQAQASGRPLIGGTHKYLVLSHYFERWPGRNGKKDSIVLDMRIDMPAEPGMYPPHCGKWAGGYQAQWSTRKWFGGIGGQFWPRTLANLRRPEWRHLPVITAIDDLIAESLDGKWRTPGGVIIQPPEEPGGYLNVKQIRWKQD